MAYVLTTVALLLTEYDAGRIHGMRADVGDYTVHFLPPRPGSHIRWDFRRALEACGLKAQFGQDSLTFDLNAENRKALTAAISLLDTRMQLLASNMSAASLLEDPELRLMPYVRRDVRIDEDGFSVVADFSPPFTVAEGRSFVAKHGHPLDFGTAAGPNIVVEDELYELQRCLWFRSSIHDILFGPQTLVRNRVKESLKEALRENPDSVYFCEGNGWTSTWLWDARGNENAKGDGHHGR